MLLSQWNAGGWAAVLLIALVGVAWGVGLAAQDRAGARGVAGMQKALSAPAPSRAREGVADAGEIIRFQGLVLDPDGKPSAGATLQLMSYGLKDPDDPPIRARSDADGRFRFEIPKSDFDTSLEDHPWLYGTILARAPGLAFGLANPHSGSGELTVRLARDDVPISGRIIDLQGRPVAGAIVRIVSVRATSSGRLDDYLRAIQERNQLNSPESEFLTLRLEIQPEPPVIAPARTDGDGRFRLAGIGRERVATLQIAGPSIETRRVMVRTQPGVTLHVPPYKDMARPQWVTSYGSTFEHVAGPTRPVEGVVRDLDSGRPLEGIMVHGEETLETGSSEYTYAITDAQGRYRLVGLPQGREGHILAIPPCDFPYYGRRKASLKVPPDESLPYLRAQVPIGKSEGPEPVHLDIQLKRGVWVTGRLIERGTQKPVSGQVEYFVFGDNPHLRAYPDFRYTMIGPHFMGTDGVFHLVAFPGPGVIAARAEGSEYIRAVGVEKLQGRRENGFLLTQPYSPHPDNFNVLDAIDPAPGVGSLTHDLLLESGRSLTVTVLGPDGKPLTALVAIGLKDMSWWEKVPPGAAAVEVLGLTPGRRRTVGFRHDAKRLVGELVLRGDETRPQTVTMQPWGVLTGRIVDADGQPAPDGILMSVADNHGTEQQIGPDGRFRIEGLIPGKPYDLNLSSRQHILRGFLARGVKLDPGETRDLGDVAPKQP